MISDPETRARKATEAAAQIAADPAFAALQAAGVPVIAAAGDPPRVVYMNAAAEGVFGSDCETMNAHLFCADEAGGRRLTELARFGRDGGAPRLERLCLPSESGLQTVTILCGKMPAEGDESYFIMATLGLRPNAETPRKPEAQTKVSASRFLWRTDAEGRFIEVTHVLADVVGSANADILGREASEVARSLGFDPDGRFEQAMAQRSSWRGIEVQWPLETSGRVATTLGGLPVFDENRRFAGFRGYGLLRLNGNVAQMETAASETALQETANRENKAEGAMPITIERANVVPLRPLNGWNGETSKEDGALRAIAAQSNELPRGDAEDALTPKEQDAFQEIARALSAADEMAPANGAIRDLTDAVGPLAEADESKTHREEEDAVARHALALLDQLPIGVVVARGADMLYANRTLLDWLGYADLDALEGACGLNQIFSGQERDSRTPQALSGSVEVLTKDGERLAVEARFETIDWDGPATFISLRRVPSRGGGDPGESQAEARLEAERASAAKSDFLAKVSHEIRTPLSAILGFTEVMMEERFGPIGNERYKEYLKDIHASGAHVLSLVNDLLDLSKIEAGKMELEFEHVNLNATIAECISIIQTQASRARVVMRQSLAPHLPDIRVDRRSLKQILLNLLSNAVKFNQPGGQVIVSSTLTDTGGVMLRVKDTGVGMSAEEIQAALEPFRQVGAARDTSGTGLGLPVTKALIEANHASFTIKSRKNEGTLVEIAFTPPQVLAAE